MFNLIMYWLTSKRRNYANLVYIVQGLVSRELLEIQNNIFSVKFFFFMKFTISNQITVLSNNKLDNAFLVEWLHT